MKKILNGFIILLLSLAIMILLLGFTTKKVISNTISNLYTKDRIVGNMINIINSEETIKSDKIEILQKSFKDDESIDEISKKYFDSIVDYYLKNNNSNSVDVKKDISKIVDKCINKYHVEECSIIKAKLDTINLDSIYSFGKVVLDNSLNEEQIALIKTYGILTSCPFIILDLIAIVSLILILYLKNKEDKKYLKLYSYILFVIAALSIIASIIINSFIIKLTSEMIQKKYFINFTLLYICSIVFIIIGIVLLLLYKKGKIKRIKK